MRFYLIVLLIGCFAGAVFAQESEEESVVDTFSRDPIPVLIEPMKYAEDIPLPFVRQMEQFAYRSIEAHWHYQVVNNSTNEALPDTVAPEYIIQLNLEPLQQQLSSQDIKDSLDQVVYTDYLIRVDLQTTLRVTEITTGELKYVKKINAYKYASGRKDYKAGTFTFSDGSNINWGATVPSVVRSQGRRVNNLPDTPEKEGQIQQSEKNRLLTQAYENWKYSWQRTLLDIFPCRIHITKVLETKRNKPQWVQIDAGENFRLKHNAYLRVYTQRNYEPLDRTFVRTEDIGWLILKEVGPQTTRAKVVGGKKDIAAALERGDVLFARIYYAKDR